MMRKPMRHVTLTMVALLATAAHAQRAGLAGNWAIENSNRDGAIRRTYFNLVQQGDALRGTIRGTQFYHRIVEGAGTPDKFTIVGTMMDGKSERTVRYEGWRVSR